MARPAALTGSRLEAARAALAAGKSPQVVSQELGVDRKTVAKLQASPGGLGPAGDDFERVQLATLRRIRRAMREQDLTALGLAALTKAQNDTIKLLRAHRLMRRPDETSEATDAAAERVAERLRRIAERSRPVVVVSDVGLEDVETEASGTDG
ncbi:MAG: hypothetical protein IPG04_17250 [Polyangiaceae bacterium]|nr:hypothetical protein [Polyangiaceae bacterium]